jgi:hypothetical protein
LCCVEPYLWSEYGRNTNLKRAPYKRPILGNLPKAAKVMPYTVRSLNYSGSFGICH